MDNTTQAAAPYVDDHLVSTNKGTEVWAIRLLRGMVERKINKL